MERLSAHFFIYLSSILLLVVGTTNYWLYKNNTERLNESLAATANSKLEGIASLSGYYMTHYENELINKLVASTISRQGVNYISITSNDGDIFVEAGLREKENSRHYSRKIVDGKDEIGLVELTLDETQLKAQLRQALNHSIMLVILTVLLIATLVFFFFRNRVIGTVKLVQAEKEFFSIVMDSANSLVVVLEGNGKIVMANKTCEYYAGVKQASIEGHLLWEYFPIECDDEQLPEMLKAKHRIDGIHSIFATTSTCISHGELNSEKVVLEWSFDIFESGEFEHAQLIATGVDVTAQYLESEKLSYMALHDSLTDLPNRTLFMDRLEQAMALYKRNQEKFCLLYVDLDKFKPINDSLGHEAGDYILKAVSGIIVKHVRETDTVARLGGDEFGIILMDIDNRDYAAQVAQKCIDAISQPFKYLNHQLELGASIGIAYYPEYNCDLIQLINYADTAMYQAKQAGSNQYCFYEHQ